MKIIAAIEEPTVISKILASRFAYQSTASLTAPGILSIRSCLIPKPQSLQSGSVLIGPSSLAFAFQND